MKGDARFRKGFAGAGAPSAGGAGALRSPVARHMAAALRVALAPAAALAAALAGLLFAVLLPICGIATIAEGFAGAAWRFAKDALSRAPHLPARRT